VVDSKPDFDAISEITKKTEADNEEEDDDMVDEMARFVEAQDSELVLDHSASIKDDEKVAKSKSYFNQSNPKNKEKDSN
jgi:hypothetical protein